MKLFFGLSFLGQFYAVNTAFGEVQDESPCRLSFKQLSDEGISVSAVKCRLNERRDGDLRMLPVAVTFAH